MTCTLIEPGDRLWDPLNRTVHVVLEVWTAKTGRLHFTYWNQWHLDSEAGFAAGRNRGTEDSIGKWGLRKLDPNDQRPYRCVCCACRPPRRKGGQGGKL